MLAGLVSLRVSGFLDSSAAHLLSHARAQCYGVSCGAFAGGASVAGTGTSEFLKEASGRGTIHGAVVESEREPDPPAWNDGVLAYGWLASQAADAEDGGLRRVDDGSETIHADVPQSGHGEGSVGDIVQFEDAIARLGGEFSETRRELF